MKVMPSIKTLREQELYSGSGSPPPPRSPLDHERKARLISIKEKEESLEKYNPITNPMPWIN